MKNFRTYDLALEFYRDCAALLEEKRFNLTWSDQFSRASLSIVLNLAEGSGKPTAKDRRKFYAIGMGSLRETQSLLMIANGQSLLEKSDRLAANLYRLMQNPGNWP